MKDNQTSPSLPEEERLFKRLRAPFSVSKEALWEQMETQMEEIPPARNLGSFRPPLRLLVAACVAILLAVGFARWYSQEVYVLNGQQRTVNLPDGSVVKLNSNSKLSYHPYWWNLDREVQLSGEAFFEVKKGEAFEVVSRQGRTRVLGTQFNVFARSTSYEVFCLEGKVRVETARQNTVDTLLPGMFWEVSAGQVMIKQQNEHEALAWMEGRLYADKQPLKRVFEAIERHYGIEVDASAAWVNGQYYSGNFKWPDNPDKALELICTPLQKEFSHHFSNQYIINP